MAVVRLLGHAMHVTGSSRRRLAVSVVLVVACSALAASTLAASRQHTVTTRMPTLANAVFADINAFRAAHHLPALTLSRQLTASATRHSIEMGTDGYFAHESPDGSAFWKRIQLYYPSKSWGYWSVGENLLWSSPTTDAATAMQLWENSPEHLANLLAPRWRQLGVSAVHVTAAPGVFHGQDVTIITTDFGARH
jgi:uncharacterized protein YkwD